MALGTKWIKTEGRVVDVTKRFSSILPGYSVVFSYRADKHRYSGAYTMLLAPGSGTVVKVEYDEANPKRVRKMIRQKIAAVVLPLILVGLFVLWVRHLSRDTSAQALPQDSGKTFAAPTTD